jgi:hypothetical protein
MTFIVDIRHLLDERGGLPLDNPVLRRRALRIAQLVEAGGPLAVGQYRETLVACVARPHRKPCPGLLWVEKTRDHRIQAYCLTCHRVEALISGWERTPWASGPMVPATGEDLRPAVDLN